MYIINMFGTGIRYRVCEIPAERFDELNSLKLKKECSWESVFFDLHELSKWGYKSLDELHVIEHECGWLLGGSNYMEIRTKGKRMSKIMAREVANKYRLFSLFNLKYDERQINSSKEYKYVILVQIEAGLIFKYKLDRTTFDVDQLTFNLNYQPLKRFFDESWVTNLFYNERPVLCTKQDALTRSSKVIVIE